MDAGSYLLPIILLIAFHALLTLAYAALTNRTQTAHETNGDPMPRLQMTYQVSVLLLRFAIAALTISALQAGFRMAAEASLVLEVAVTILVLVLVALVTLILGEIVPEAIGSNNAESLALWSQRLMNVLITLLNPVVTGIIALSRSIAGMFGSRDKVNVFTEEEIMTMLDASEKEGSIENAEKEMIYSVLQFGDRLAREVMVPRIDVIAVEMDTPLSEALELFVSSGHSRLPVYEETVDTIKGLLYAKDLLNIQGDKAKKSIREMMRPTLFVPESKSAAELLKELRHKKIHLAVVVDEYGGTAGILTVEDLIEEIIGDIQDEYDVDEEADYTQQGPNTYVVDGSMSLNDFNDALGVEFSTEESDTVGGFVFTQLGHIPDAGETIEHNNLVLRVDSIDGRRIRKIHVTRKAAPNASGSQSSNNQPTSEVHPVTE